MLKKQHMYAKTFVNEVLKSFNAKNIELSKYQNGILGESVSSLI